MEPSFTQFHRRTTRSQFVKVLRTPAFNAENRICADSRFSLTQLASRCEFYGQVEPQQFLLMETAMQRTAVFFIIHIVQGYVLEVQNRGRRGIAYNVPMGSRGSTWYRKSMGLLGTLVFLFLIVHIADFWIPSRFGGLDEVMYDDMPGRVYHNLYGKMAVVFQNQWIVILYIIGCISLAWHLIHGFQSSFRTLGVSNKRYLAILNGTGWAFSIIVCLLFAMMPVSVYLGWVK